MEWMIPVILTIITAATPLVFAAIGELIVEKAGVLNLGVEGMMLTGAIAAFAIQHATGSATLAIFGAMICAAGMAFIFGFLTLTMLANQVATGLALTIFGIGLSALIDALHGTPTVSRRIPIDIIIKENILDHVGYDVT